MDAGAQPSPRSPTTLQTVERALAFLEYVASAAEPPTVQLVAAEMQLNISTCYHLLRTLLGCGYVERRADGTLQLGNRIGVLFRSYQRTLGVDQHLAFVVDRIARDTSETAFLSALSGTSVILKFLAEGSQPLRVSGLYVGLAGNEHKRASGKAVMAYLDPETSQKVLNRSLSHLAPPQRKEALEKLEADLRRTRERGWSLDGEESDTGISSVGAPVFGADGRVYGAVGVVTPTSRMDRQQDSFVAVVTAAAHQVSELLQSRPRT